MKIVAIASVGGHLIELLRMKSAFHDMDVVYISTNPNCSSMVEGYKFYSVTDASRWNKLKLIQSFFQVLSVIFKEKPDAVITTGAAPGLMGIIAGRILGAKTIWVDSIANVDELSMSGRIACKIADRVYTQWPDLAKSKIIYSGNILS